MISNISRCIAASSFVQCCNSTSWRPGMPLLVTRVFVSFEYKAKRNRQYIVVKSLPEGDGKTPTEMAQEAASSGGTLTRRQKNLIKFADLGRPGSREYETAEV